MTGVEPVLSAWKAEVQPKTPHPRGTGSVAPGISCRPADGRSSSGTCRFPPRECDGVVSVGWSRCRRHRRWHGDWSGYRPGSRQCRGRRRVGCRRLEPLETVRPEFIAMGRRAFAVSTDVTSADELERPGRHATEELGPISIWVNNAAGLQGEPMASLTSVTEASWHTMIDRSLSGGTPTIGHDHTPAGESVRRISSPHRHPRRPA